MLILCAVTSVSLRGILPQQVRQVVEVGALLGQVGRWLPSEQALVIPRLRRPIERLFLLWKEHGCIGQWRSK